MVKQPWNQPHWNGMGESVSEQEFHVVGFCSWWHMEPWSFWIWPSCQFWAATMELQINGKVDCNNRKILIYSYVSRRWLSSQECHSHHTNPFAYHAPTHPQHLEKSHNGRPTSWFLIACCYALMQSNAAECLWGLGQGGVILLYVHCNSIIFWARITLIYNQNNYYTVHKQPWASD